MGLFGKLITLGRVKADEAAEKIEDANQVGFSKQALKEMHQQLNDARQNVGKMKAQKMSIERMLKEQQQELSDNTDKAKQLAAKAEADGSENLKALALKVAGKCLEIKEQISETQKQINMVVSNLQQQETNVSKLNSAVQTAERDIQSMKAMEQVAKSTESLLDISTSGAENALSKFKSGKEKMQRRLDEKQAVLTSQTAGDSMDAEVNAALGNSGDAAAADFLKNL